MMSTKMKGKKAFFRVSLSCLGSAAVALVLSTVSLVVVTLVPRPHLYWSGCENTCSRGSVLLKRYKRVGTVKRWKLFRLLDASVPH